jgi:hypothetical protein
VKLHVTDLSFTKILKDAVRSGHARFGGQQQGGIITPANHPVEIIITGEDGLQHGYAVLRL